MILLLLLLLLAAPGWAQPNVTVAKEGIEIQLSLDHVKRELGQSVRATLEFQIPEDVEFSPPPVDKLEPKPFELQDGSVSKLPGGKTRYVLRVAAFDTGELEFPPMSFTFKRGGKEFALDSPSMKVEVVRVPAAKTDKPDEIRDAKPPVRAPFPPLLAALLLLLLLCALWSIWKLVQWWRRPRAKPVEPALPPYDLAMRDLAQLERERPLEEGRVGEFYERLTLILRSYFGWRFDENMLEMTSSEILQSLKKHQEFGIDHWRQLRAILEDADLVKFANVSPGNERSLEHLGVARSLIEAYPPKTVAVPA